MKSVVSCHPDDEQIVRYALEEIGLDDYEMNLTYLVDKGECIVYKAAPMDDIMIEINVKEYTQ